jgi:transcriptional regulator with XRE-family HTH domain
MTQYESISAFLKDSMPRGQLKAIATAMGISPSQLSALRTGKKKAGPLTCRRIAAFFKIPVEEAFRIAGILDERSESSLVERVTEQLENDADFRSFVEAYLDTKSPGGKKRMLATALVLANELPDQNP